MHSFLVFLCCLAVIVFFAAIAGIVVYFTCYHNKEVECQTPKALKFSSSQYLDSLIRERNLENVPTSAYFGVPVFIVSMHPERFNHANKLLESLGVDNVQLLDAVVGKNTDMAHVEQVGVITALCVEQQPKGAVGCLLSHVILWKWLIDRPDIPYIITFEEDIGLDPILMKNDKYFLQNYVSKAVRTEMASDWLILYLGSCGDDCKNFSRVSAKNDFLNRTPSSFCTHAYAISQLGARTFLSRLPFDTSVDTIINRIYNTDNLKAYATKPCFFWQDAARWPSDIRAQENTIHNITQCA